MRAAFRVCAGFLGIVAVLVPVACRRKMSDESSTSSGLTLAECNEILAGAGQSVGAALKVANPPGRKSCGSDADCVEGQPASCVSFCFGHGIPKGAASTFSVAMTSVEAKDCGRWYDAGCPAVVPRPTSACAKASPRCVEGACKMVEDPAH
jgi:hypothetical protein